MLWPLILIYAFLHSLTLPVSGTLVKGRRDVVYVNADAVNQVIAEVETLGSLVKELQQKIKLLEDVHEKIQEFGFRVVNVEQVTKLTREEVRTVENKLEDRLEALKTELVNHQNLTNNFATDYCKLNLKANVGLIGGSEFCLQKSQKTNLRSIPARYILGNVVSKPKARLYTGANFSGSFEDFNFDSKFNPECLTLTKFYGGVGSLNTFSTCVRLYNHEDCWIPWIRNPRTFETPKSMAFYPQLTTENSLDWAKEKFLKEVKSVGPCFENELDDSQLEVNVNGVKGYRKPKGMNGTPFIPDLVYIGDGGNYEGTISRPIYGYRTGYRGRVEFIRASVDHNHFLWGRTRQLNVTKADRDFYGQLDKEEGDQLGHFVGAAFGPLQEDLPFHNVFPQTRQNRNFMAKLESKIVESLSQSQNADRLVSIRINVDYESRTSTRPTGLSYLINFEDGVKSINYLTNMLAS